MNLKKSLVLVICFVFLLNCNKKDGENWILLFNGKDLTGWTAKISGYPLGDNFYNTFRVENGILKVSYDGYDNFDDSFGHLFYERPFSNYILKLQYRFVGQQIKGGQDWAKKNSGVMIHSQSPESMDLNQAFPVSLEVQLLGGIEKPIERSTGNLCTPGMHVTINDTFTTEHCIPSSGPTFYGDEWIDLEIEAHHDSLIIHRINGKDVIKYSKPIFGGEFNTNFQEGNPVKGGYISLQSESHPIEFKNIKLLELKS
ncbi:3-keto-disaccharide hydrolase [Yeosuana sp. AK3]